MFRDLAVLHLVHVNLLNLEMPTGRLYAHEHSTINGTPPYAAMSAGERAANHNPIPINHRIEHSKLGVRECAFDIRENRPHTGTANLPTMVSAIFGIKFRGRIDVTAIKGVVLLLHQSQVGVGSVHVAFSCRGTALSDLNQPVRAARR